MKKDIFEYRRYLSNNYYYLRSLIANKYTLDLDTFHDCILGLYDSFCITTQFDESMIEVDFCNAYKKYRNIQISDSFKLKNKEDNILEYIDNKTDKEVKYSTCKRLKDRAKLILSKENYMILDLYYFQNKPKRTVSIFTGVDICQIDKKLAFIRRKLLKHFSYETH